MKKVIISGLVAGVVLLIFSILGLYLTIWFFPKLAGQYYSPTFDVPVQRYMLYYIHPFVISLALAWFWQRIKGVLTGSFITRGIEFGLIFTAVCTIPMMLLIYSAIDVSIRMVAAWTVFGLLQGLIAGLIFEKTNP